jgi:type 1 fimbriae regulatory protein FimE
MSNAATKAARTDRAPTTETGTVIDFSRNDERSRRAYLTPDEVDRLMKAARSRGRYGHRDATMILLAYRHGLRVGELVTLRWDQIDLKLGRIQELSVGLGKLTRARGPAGR